MSEAGFIAVICGLKSEARAIRRSIRNAAVSAAKLRVGIAGADAKRAEEIGARLCAEGARAVISAGISGALDPALKRGDLLVGERVVTASGEIFRSDRKLLDAADRLAPKRAVIFGADEIIATAEAKRQLFARYAAGAVDMESGGAARAARAAGVPFIAIRAIADDAKRSLPKAVLGAVAEDGGVRPLSALAGCLNAPEEFEQVLLLARDSEIALGALRRGFGEIFGSLLGALDL